MMGHDRRSSIRLDTVYLEINWVLRSCYGFFATGVFILTTSTFLLAAIMTDELNINYL